MNEVLDRDVQAFLERAEERGEVGEVELEALAFEQGLDEDELNAVTAELAAREVEIAPAAERNEESSSDGSWSCASASTASSSRSRPSSGSSESRESDYAGSSRRRSPGSKRS